MSGWSLKDAGASGPRGRAPLPSLPLKLFCRYLATPLQVAPPEVPQGYISDAEVLVELGEQPAQEGEPRFCQYMRARLVSPAGCRVW